MEQFIGNYALMYALNNEIEEIHRITSGTKPFYSEDRKKMHIYATPACPLFYSKLSHDLLTIVMDNAFQVRNDYKEQNKVKFTYNAVGESIAFGMKPAQYNIPNLGNYEKFSPLNIFYTFIFGGRGASVIRLGKKQVPCRIYYHEIENITEISGEYAPAHPINLNEFDFKANDFISGEIIHIRPVPLLVNAFLKGKFLKCSIMGSEFYIILPNKPLYPNIF